MIFKANNNFTILFQNYLYLEGSVHIYVRKSSLNSN